MDNLFLHLSILMFAGLLGGKLVKQFKLPNVTGYLLAGLIVGPSLFNLVTIDSLHNVEKLCDMALGFIAFSIGCEFKMSYFKRVGMTPVIIAIFEGLGATFVVSVILIVLGYDQKLALLLGAIASATAPAATLMVIKQYKAKGIVTETLMSVVAIDDAVALICFGFVAAIVNQSANASIIMSLLAPIQEVLVSLVLGFLSGLVFLIPLKYFSNRGNRTTILIASVLIVIALATYVNASSLLTCMAMGASFINFNTKNDDIFTYYDNITPPLLLLFFVISGAELNLMILPNVGAIGILYIVFRVIGKVVGAALGAKISKAEPKVAKYIGYTLVPQAGVAIGLSILSAKIVPQYSETITAVVLSATFIYEIFGPSITKKALQNAQEINAHL